MTPRLLLIVITLWGGFSLARADEMADAKRLFEAGRQLYNTGEYEEAIRSFQQAYGLSQRPGLLYNIAIAYEKKGELVQAREYFVKYLAASPQAEDKDEVIRKLEALDRRLRELQGSVSITSKPEGATVLIDEGAQGQGVTPYQARLAPGRHEVKVTLEGYAPIHQSFHKADNLHASLAFILTAQAQEGHINLVGAPLGAQVYLDGRYVGSSPLPDPIATPPGSHTLMVNAEGRKEFFNRVEVILGQTVTVEALLPSAGPGGLAIGGYSSLAASGAAAVAVAILGALALQTQSDIEGFDKSSSTEARRREYFDLVDKADGLALGTDVLLGVGSALVVTGVVLLTLDYFKDR